jgi:hypothetical protein
MSEALQGQTAQAVDSVEYHTTQSLKICVKMLL